MKKVYATVHATHIEQAARPFYVRFYRPPYFNEFQHEGGERVVKVLAETEHGALKIARYHWTWGCNFVIDHTACGE